MRAKYKVGHKVTAFKGYKVGNTVYADLYSGVIILVAKNKAEGTHWYQLDYGTEKEPLSIMVFEDEIDFIQMTIR